MNFPNLALRRKLFVLVLIFKLTNSSGQVPVHEEPRHHLVFESKEIRILNVLIPPGDTTLYHVHSTPSLFIRLTGTTTGSQLKGGTPSSGSSTPGTVLFENLAAPNIRTHRVWNADKDTFNVMDVELLSKDPVFDKPPLTMPNLKLEIDTSWVRSYRLDIPKGTEFTLKSKNQLMILISVSDGSLQTQRNGDIDNRTVKPGSYFVIKGKQSFAIKNTGDKNTQFVLVELPPHK